jgi:hypothetical protein
MNKMRLTRVVLNLYSKFSNEHTFIQYPPCILYDRGPTSLIIKDSDKVQATAGGSIKVGKYSFKLTVKDVEELTSSATLDVNVKQGRLSSFIL